MMLPILLAEERGLPLQTQVAELSLREDVKHVLTFLITTGLA